MSLSTISLAAMMAAGTFLLSNISDKEQTAPTPIAQVQPAPEPPVEPKAQPIATALGEQKQRAHEQLKVIINRYKVLFKDTPILHHIDHANVVCTRQIEEAQDQEALNQIFAELNYKLLRRLHLKLLARNIITPHDLDSDQLMQANAWVNEQIIAIATIEQAEEFVEALQQKIIEIKTTATEPEPEITLEPATPDDKPAPTKKDKIAQLKTLIANLHAKIKKVHGSAKRSLSAKLKNYVATYNKLAKPCKKKPAHHHIKKRPAPKKRTATRGSAKRKKVR